MDTVCPPHTHIHLKFSYPPFMVGKIFIPRFPHGYEFKLIPTYYDKLGILIMGIYIHLILVAQSLKVYFVYFINFYKFICIPNLFKIIQSNKIKFKSLFFVNYLNKNIQNWYNYYIVEIRWVAIGRGGWVWGD